MDFSRKIKAEAKRNGIDVREKAFADLVNVGWDVMDAYFAVNGLGMNYSESYLRKEVDRMRNAPAMVRYAEKIGGSRKRDDGAEPIGGTLSLEEALALTSKEEMIRELTMTREGLPMGSKERLEANKILIDLQQMKKEIVQEEDKTVHYYLPLPCNLCSLYMEREKERGKARKPRMTRDVDTEAVTIDNPDPPE